MRKAETVKEVLIAARWILENVGWRQLGRINYPRDYTGPRCAVAAILSVETLDGLHDKARACLPGDIVSINDRGTKEQVFAVFDKAIAKAS
jgi:hypothetical protein